MHIEILDSSQFASAPDSYMVDRAAAAAALALVEQHGDSAVFHAAANAEESRARGNVPSFCRWRQIERLIAAMQFGGGTLH